MSEIDNDHLVVKAKKFATKQHRSANHRRKYNCDPYEVHLQAVVDKLQSIGASEETLAAAWLHDTVEDTETSLFQIENLFGEEVAKLVFELTDVSKPSDGNRAKRKSIDLQHIAFASTAAKSIKLADLIDNAKSIQASDPAFAQTFLREMKLLLGVLKEADSGLYAEAQNIVDEFFGCSSRKIALK